MGGAIAENDARRSPLVDMVIWVKTTIDIATGLLMEAKERAQREQTTLRALVERGLSIVLAEPPARARPPLTPVTGRLEPLPGVDPNDWEAIRETIYEAPGRA
jgi:hypothetical protein